MSAISNVYVGIIDEGVMPHADIAANLFTNDFGIRLDGIDNDGNGYVDDTTRLGFRRQQPHRL